MRLVCRRLNELCAARLNSSFNRLQNNMLVRFQSIKVGCLCDHTQRILYLFKQVGLTIGLTIGLSKPASNLFSLLASA